VTGRIDRSSTRVGNKDGKRAESVGVTLSTCIRQLRPFVREAYRLDYERDGANTSTIYRVQLRRNDV